ncbi:MAG TPA: FeoA family protein [Candidatus Limiplasma sp.]|nr:FeoA family protein [Candidatus Limiplasma sp.]
MVPLSMVSVGDVNVIKKITGRDDVRKHLANLGFVVGEEVIVVNQLGGNLILSIKNSRVALDQTLATRIMV